MIGDKLLKFIAAGALLASVFYLVILGMVQPTEYLLLVGTALAALGINRIPAQPAPPPSPTIQQPQPTEGAKP